MVRVTRSHNTEISNRFRAYRSGDGPYFTTLGLPRLWLWPWLWKNCPASLTTYAHIPSFIKIRRKKCGRTDGQIDIESGFIRSAPFGDDLKSKSTKKVCNKIPFWELSRQTTFKMNVRCAIREWKIALVNVSHSSQSIKNNESVNQ